jgi:hypothetical protein
MNCGGGAAVETGGRMITIGLRAAPGAVTFAVYDSDERRVLNIEQIKIPSAFSVPDGLKYLRNNILDVLREYGVDNAGIRITEPTARTLNVGRVQMEGVIQEAFASSGVRSYYVGQISSISARLGIDRSLFKPLIDGSEDYPLDNWDNMAAIEREAVLCAVGAINA